MGKATDPAADLRAAIQEAHGLLRDLRTERRAVEQLVRGVRHQVAAEVKTALDKQLELMVEACKTYIAVAEERILKRFEALSEILMGDGTPNGKPRLEDMTQVWLDAQPPHVREQKALLMLQAIQRGAAKLGITKAELEAADRRLDE